jgi:hypothetical protein
MKSLDTIDSFGAIDADNDEILLECFEDHEAFLDLINFKKFLVIGRKGTGKTAIFKKILTNRSSDFFSFGHTFDDYPWSHHDKQARVGVPDNEKYTHSWKYLILMTVSKIILNQDKSLPYNYDSMDHMLKIESFVIDSYGTRDPDITQIFSPTKQLRLKPKFEIDLKLFKAGVSPESVPMEELPTIISEVNQNLLNSTLSCLNPDNLYYICFDQLDLGFNPGDTNYANRLVGLILACRDINIRAKEYGKKLFVCVFLRNDIYNGLHFEDKNKITENFLSLIEWDTSRTKKTLMGLMEKRFQKLLADNEQEVITWDMVFDETKTMTGHQPKYQHIVDRTFLRPRDIIKFSNEILSQYKGRIRNGKDNENLLIENIDINSARSEYSNYFLRELDDEIYKHIPIYKDYLDIFKTIGCLQFSKEDFFKAFESKKAGYPGITDSLSILKDLYDFSIIAYYKAGGKGYGGSEYVFKYQNTGSSFDSTSSKFKLHPGLMDVLELKKYIRV